MSLLTRLNSRKKEWWCGEGFFDGSPPMLLVKVANNCCVLSLKFPK